MSTQIDRNEVEALLVFLANGTLEGDERVAVEAAVATDPGLQAQLAVLKRMRMTMQAESVSESPGALGLSRLIGAIMTEAPPQTANTNAPLKLWRIAAIVALALLATQTFLTLRGGDLIRLAGGGTEYATGPTLTVAFSGTASEAAIRKLLQDLDLTIVAGPSAIGLYTLAARDETARDVAVERLGAETAIVESVEAGE